MDPTPYVREPGYALRYRDQRFRTASGPRTDARERRALQRILSGTQEVTGPWLDVPSGAGRMSGELPGRAIQVDRDPKMLAASDGSRARACACATALPFADETFAGVLCCRLLQHLPTPAERIAVLRELRRVSRGPVVATFFDRTSVQSLRRAIRRAMGKTRSGRGAISRAQFERDAVAAGLRVVRFVALRRFLTEQTFALCVPISRA